MASYLAGAEEPEARAERMADLENRILPKSAEHLGWPDDLSLDFKSVIRWLFRRKQ